MVFDGIARRWCALDGDARVVIIADEAREALARELAGELPGRCRVERYDGSGAQMERLRALDAGDLAVALFSMDAFLGGARAHYSPFGKPEGVRAKYAFIRLDIGRRSLEEALATPRAEVEAMLARMAAFGDGERLRVTGPGGTDMRLNVRPFTTCSHFIDADGGMAFLPPSETSSEVVPGSAQGVIAVDVTVGQFYFRNELRERFGLVDGPVLMRVEEGRVVSVEGGRMARRLGELFDELPDECRELVELGQGLSRMTPTGLTGVDESIIDTCHFGIGDGMRSGLHLDVIIRAPRIRAEREA